MPDQYTETTTVGYGSRIVNSIGAVLLGVILFLASFVVLYWNEGREDMSRVAKQAVEMNADSPTNVPTDGTLVAAQGKLTSSQTLGDTFTLPPPSQGVVTFKPGSYVAVYRTAEMYAWIENKESKTTKNVGGSETTQTTYTYKQEWTNQPPASTDFKYPDGHENPPLLIQNNEARVSSAQVGDYNVDMNAIDLPPGQSVQLGLNNVSVPATGAVVTDQYLYIGKQSLASPQIGDVRVGYAVVPANTTVTAFGKIHNRALDPYFDAKNNKLYRIFDGNKDMAVATLHSEYETWVWIFRGIGFVMMWLGLTALFSPLVTLLDVLPFLGDVSQALIGLITFGVALVLSLVTIVISMILHNIVALVVVVAIAVAFIVVWLKRFRHKKITTATA